MCILSSFHLCMLRILLPNTLSLTSSQVSTWFFQKRGAALGLVAAGSSLGGVIFPIMVVHLIPEVGFGWTMRICAFLILALLVFANLTVRSRIQPTRRPISAMAFIRPLKEPSFALLTASIFFFYWGMFVSKSDSFLLFHQRLIATRSHSPSSFSKLAQRACLSIWRTT